MVKETLVVLFCIFAAVNTLDNGLALTPPMGWLTWQRFRCITDCINYPDDCISEQLIRDMADRMAEDGYLDAGYEYIIIDDCWLATERDSEGRLQADVDRFPNGVAALADYVHSKGLKFGIYEDLGPNTCAGYPGIGDNLELDANTFADWGVDYLKIGACNENTNEMEERFVEFGAYLNQTGRPILYSCGYPAYIGLDTNWRVAIETCNSWRIYNSIDDSWDSVRDIINWFSSNQGYLNRFAGQGHWHDPDMLIVGDYGLSYDESIGQMTVWSILASPLIMSVDLRTITPEFRDILLNENAIKINQDSSALPGLLSWTRDDVNIWVKNLSPDDDGLLSYAFGIVSFRYGGGPYVFNITLYNFGLDNADGYIVTNVFGDVDPVRVSIDDPLEISVNPSSAVLLHMAPIHPNN